MGCKFENYQQICISVSPKPSKILISIQDHLADIFSGTWNRDHAVYIAIVYIKSTRSIRMSVTLVSTILYTPCTCVSNLETYEKERERVRERGNWFTRIYRSASQDNNCLYMFICQNHPSVSLPIK